MSPKKAAPYLTFDVEGFLKSIVDNGNTLPPLKLGTHRDTVFQMLSDAEDSWYKDKVFGTGIKTIHLSRKPKTDDPYYLAKLSKVKTRPLSEID